MKKNFQNTTVGISSMKTNKQMEAKEQEAKEAAKKAQEAAKARYKELKR